jgi:hypothetical protein
MIVFLPNPFFWKEQFQTIYYHTYSLKAIQRSVTGLGLLASPATPPRSARHEPRGESADSSAESPTLAPAFQSGPYPDRVTDNFLAVARKFPRSLLRHDLLIARLAISPCSARCSSVFRFLCRIAMQCSLL